MKAKIARKMWAILQASAIAITSRVNPKTWPNQTGSPGWTRTSDKRINSPASTSDRAGSNACDDNGLGEFVKQDVDPVCTTVCTNPVSALVSGSQSLSPISRIAEAWPHLPSHIQATILTLINPVSAAANEQADTPKLTVHLPSVQEQYPDGATTDRIRRTVLAALRHSPEHFGLRMDVEGWVDLLEVGHLINSFAIGTQFTNRESVRLALQHLGLGDRLLFSLDYCRAAYGHSTPSFSPRVTATPDSCLYHGTSAEALRMIDCFGLQPMKRRFVQLTTDCNYANQIAQNASSSPVVLEIACKPAIECGVQFFPTGSHVWLSTAIPSDCLHVWLSSSSALSNRDSLRNR